MARALQRVLVAVAIVASACNLLTGSNDLRTDGNGATSGGNGDGGGSSGGGTSSSGAVPMPLPDGGETLIDPNLIATLAQCGEAGFSGICVPSQDGWTSVTSGTLSVLGCPDGYPTRETYRSPGGGCTCECTPAGGTCDGTISVRDGTQCGNAARQLPPLPGDGGCVVTPFVLEPGGVVATLAPRSPPTSCSGTSRSQFAPTGVSAEICTGATAVPSTRCAAHEGCFARVSFLEGSRNCIVHAGDVGCPAKMPRRTVIGSKVDDGRTCGPCACGVSGCQAGAVVQFFRRDDCIGSDTRVDFGTNCTTNAIGTDAGALRYQAASGCNVTAPPVASGAPVVTEPRTLCCADPNFIP